MAEKNVIVNVSEDSESKLEDLFNVLTNENTSRKSNFGEGLPSSFHQMPDKSEKTVGPSIQVPGHPMKGSGHNRGMSLPVPLPSMEQGMPLPPGWEVGKTPEGHHYFIK